MKRRGFMILLGAVGASPLAARAQPAAKMPRIGFLSQSAGNPMDAQFRAGLRELGWIDAQNVDITWRFANGDLDRLGPLATDLVRANVDVIVTAATPAAKAAQNATRTIPIVAVDPGDPVQAGLVASLARPGGNITAESSIAPDLEAKRLQLLQEIAPKIARLAVLSNAAIPPAEVAVQELKTAAKSLNIEVLPVEVRGPGDFAAAFAAMANQHADSLLVFHDPLTAVHGQLISDFANKSRLPAMYGSQDFVEKGGLMSYGPSYPDMFERAGVYVGRILKGAKPADLPVEQPTKFYLVLNLKTANALGLTVPPNLLALADNAIE